MSFTYNTSSYSAVLFFYLLQLGMGDKNATVVYHAFAILAYFTPLLGAYLADGYLGKFTCEPYLKFEIFY